MSKKLLLFVAIIVGGLFFAGCKPGGPGGPGGAVYNVIDATAQGYDKKLTATQVEKAIVDAGSKLKWQMKKVSSGLILATVLAGETSAAVEIKFTANNYSIIYKDSQNLKYDGTNINNRYNGWIKRLDTAIQNNLMMM